MITIDQVMAWKPCYSQEQVEELFAGRDFLTIEDIYALDISAKDRFWVLLREELIPAAVLHEFACRIAEQVLTLKSESDPRCVAAIAAKRAWVRGEIDNAQLRAAMSVVQYIVSDVFLHLRDPSARSAAGSSSAPGRPGRGSR
jgi:hypothetical protein